MKFSTLVLIVLSLGICGCRKSGCPAPNQPSVYSSISSWSLRNSGISGNLFAVDFPTSTTGYISGANGVVYKTSDGGGTYQNICPLVGYDYFALDFVSENIGYLTNNLSSSDSKLYKTIDGAQSWQELPIPPHIWRAITFLNANVGFVGGTILNNVPPAVVGKLFKTTDGGQTWTEIVISNLNTVRSIFFVDNNNGYLCGEQGQFLKTTDGGLTWTLENLNLNTPIPVTQLSSNDIYFKNVNEGFCLTNTLFHNDSFLMKTIDGGNSWTRIVLPNSGYSSFDNYSSIEFYDSNTGYITGGNITADTGSILKSLDGGNTWVQMTVNTPRLIGMSLVNSTTGYAVGNAATVLISK